MDYLICGQKQHSQRSPLNVLIIPYFMILFPYRIYFVTDTKRVLLRLRYVSFAWNDYISTAIACKTIFTYLTICYLMVVKPTELLRLGIEPSLREFTELPQTSSLLPAIIYLENNRQPYYKNCSTATDTYKKRNTIWICTNLRNEL